MRQMETHLTTFIMLDLLFRRSHMSFILMWVYSVRWCAWSGILVSTLTTRLARKVKSTRKTKYFHRIISGGIYYIIIWPQLSILNPFTSSCLQAPEIPSESAYCHGLRVSYMIWQIKGIAFRHKEMCLSFLSRGMKEIGMESERAVIENTPAAKACILPPSPTRWWF